MGEGRRANPWKELLAGCYTDLSPNAPHGPRRPKLAARLFPIPMLLTAPSQRKRIRWTSTIKGTSTGSFLLVGLRSCVARPARSRRIKRRSSSWSSTPSGNYLKQSWPTTRTAQARWHHGRILLAEHDMIPVSCDPSRQESATGDCPAQHPCWSWHSLIPSPGGVHPGTVCGGSAAAWWGLRNLRTKSMGLGFLGVGRSSGEDVPPTLALSPSIPRPPNRVRGRGMKRPRARETGREKI